MGEPIPDGLARRAFEACNASIMVTAAREGRYHIVFVNAAFERLTGYARSEVIGRNPRFLQADDRAQSALREIRAALAEERSAVAVLRNYRKDGSMFWNELRLAPVRAADGGVTHWIGIQNDVTAARSGEEQRQEAEQRFRLMADAAPVMIWMSGADKGYAYVNKGWLDFTGRSFDQVLGDGWADSVHDDDRRRALATYSEAFEKMILYRVEYRLRRRDGAYRWILETGAPRLSESGRLEGFVGSCLDVTDRVEAVQAVLAREARFRSIAENTYDWETWIGPFRKPLWINSAVERMTGYSIDECMAMRSYPLPLVHREDRQRFVAELKKAHGNNVPFRIIRKDKSVGWAAISWQTIADEHGAFRGLRTSVREISSIETPSGM